MRDVIIRAGSIQNGRIGVLTTVICVMSLYESDHFRTDAYVFSQQSVLIIHDVIVLVRLLQN